MAVYYVDYTGGADGNNGLSTGAAWKTLTNVNGTTFSPGDQILFKRGETWTGTIVATASGTISNPITYGAYGTGAKPIINGGVLLAGWSKTAGRTNVYEASVSGYNLDTVFSGSYATVWYGSDYRWMSKVADIATVDSTARSCFYDTAADKIYVRTAESSNPGADGVSYYISGYDIGVNLNGQSYVTVENIVFTRMCSHAVFPMVAGTPFIAGVGQTINDCEVYGVRHNAFSMAGSKMKANRCTVHYAGGEGGAFVVADLSDYPGIGQNIRTDDIEINDCATGSTSSIWAPGVYAPKAILMEFNPSNIKVNNFTLNGQQSFGFYDVDVSYGASNVTIDGFKINGVAVTSAVASFGTTTLSVSRLRMKGRSSIAVDIYNTSNFTLKRSSIYSSIYGIRFDGSYSNVNMNYNNFDGGTYNVLINSGSGAIYGYNNIFSKATTYAIAVAGTPGTDIFKNNIFLNCPSAIYLSTIGGWLSDYNIGFGITYWWLNQTLATWQSITQDVHSSIANPNMYGLYSGDFRLKSNSPCINAGTPVGLLEDYLGTRPGEIPDIGIYEYKGRYSIIQSRTTRV